MLWMSLNGSSTFVKILVKLLIIPLEVYEFVYVIVCVCTHVCMRDWERENTYGDVNMEMGC